MVETGSTLPTVMTVEQRADKADEFARLVNRLQGERDSAKEDARQHREEIEAIMDELQKLAAVVNAGLEPKSQLDLSFPQEQAAKALHDVAAAACTCDPTPEVHNPSCPTHGVDSARSKTEAELREKDTADEALAAEVRKAAATTSEPSVVLCVCGKPATCVGHYDGDENEAEQPACDDCCQHGQEHGSCRPIPVTEAHLQAAVAPSLVGTESPDEPGSSVVKETGTPPDAA